MSHKFLTHHPFTTLLEYGWQLDVLGAPVLRAGADDFVRVATFGRGDQGVSVDVNRYGQMSQFATYTAGEDTTLVVETPTALVFLATRVDEATVEEWKARDDITTVGSTY